MKTKYKCPICFLFSRASFIFFEISKCRCEPLCPVSQVSWPAAPEGLQLQGDPAFPVAAPLVRPPHHLILKHVTDMFFLFFITHVDFICPDTPWKNTGPGLSVAHWPLFCENVAWRCPSSAWYRTRPHLRTPGKTWRVRRSSPQQHLGGVVGTAEMDLFKNRVLERLRGSCWGSTLNFVTVVVRTRWETLEQKLLNCCLWRRKSAAAEGGLRLIPQTSLNTHGLSDGEDFPSWVMWLRPPPQHSGVWGS